MIVATFPMPAGLVFDWHTHDDHQVAWAASGVLTVRTADATWVLPPTRALWIPAGLPHETLSSGPVAMTTIDLRLPDDDRARQVALGLLDDPADKRTLPEWGREVGASARTLARGFVTGTGLPFGRWRTLLRLQAALPALAAGEPVSAVARRAGYDTVSAFVAAFRRETGSTPAAYFAASTVSR